MSTTRNPAKFRRDHTATQRHPRPARRRQTTRSAIIAAAIREG